MKPILSVDHISVQFKKKKKCLTAVDQISFDVRPGEILGIVGESGCGKSVTSLAIMRLLASNAFVSEGKILYEGQDLLSLSEKEMCRFRGNQISMIFQDPMTALSPTRTIGKQLMEPFLIHQGCSKKEAFEKGVDMLRKVGISSPEMRMKQYPHQMSGGMLQRVVIAMALACRPKVLIADEPTTALDVTIQAQILDLILELREELGTAVILITHDMGVVAECADRVLVLYAGKMVECASVGDLFEHPKHPYTQALLQSIPDMETQEEKLNVIPGVVPMLDAMPKGCRFAPRCSRALPICKEKAPEMYTTAESMVSCFHYESGDEHE
jgi:peptide/nickel transport system ATP-binding protein